jgi:hypothetical protein
MNDVTPPMLGFVQDIAADDNLPGYIRARAEELLNRQEVENKKVEDIGKRIRFNLPSVQPDFPPTRIYGVILEDGTVREEFATNAHPNASNPSLRKRGEIHKLTDDTVREEVSAEDWLKAALNDESVEVGSHCPRCGHSLVAEEEQAEVSVGIIHAMCRFPGEEVA